MKKILCALLLCLTALSILPAHAREDAWRTVYEGVSDQGVQKAFLADIDLDGTPELWHLKDGAFFVYTARDGQAVPLSVQHSSHPAADAQITLLRKKGSGYVWRVETALESGGTSISHYYYAKNSVRFKDSFRITNGKYYFNGIRVTKSAYTKKWNTFQKNHTAVEYTVLSGKNIASAPYTDVPPIYPEKIKLKKTKRTLQKGASHTFSCTLSPSCCTGRHLTVTSSDESVVCVGEGTCVTAVHPGTAVVTVTADNGVRASCTVTVPPPKPESVTVVSASGENTVFGKQYLQLTAAVFPEDALQKVTWSSSKKSVATVSKTGLVKGVKAGTATITAKTKSGKKGKFKVTVLKPISVTRVDMPLRYHELAEGESFTLRCSVFPENATNRTLSWYSDDESIAVTDENGTVTGVSIGETVITAVSANGLSSSCTVRVHSGDGVTRRAFVLGTGNNDYIASHDIDDPEQKANEVWQISQMLQAQTFPTEIEITTMVNPYRASAALSAIENAFRDADDDDVNYLYLVCHGSNPASGTYELAVGTNGSITGSELRNALKDAKGTFYIFVEACYSGDLIGKGASASTFDAQAFTDDFARSCLSAKSGELAQERFHLFCSGSSREESTYFWVDRNRNMSIFGYALSMAGGWEPALYEETSRSVALAADTDKDNCVTETELRSYLTAKIRAMSKKKQTLCVWPKTADDSVLFRKETK